MKERNLLIIGAGVYGAVAKEIAQATGRFDEISFIDDGAKIAYSGDEVIGTVEDIESLSCAFANVSVAIGNPAVRLSLIGRIEERTSCKVVSLISPLAYVSGSAEIGRGSIVEPMAVIHAV